MCPTSILPGQRWLSRPASAPVCRLCVSPAWAQRMGPRRGGGEAEHLEQIESHPGAPRPSPLAPRRGLTYVHTRTGSGQGLAAPPRSTNMGGPKGRGGTGSSRLTPTPAPPPLGLHISFVSWAALVGGPSPSALSWGRAVTWSRLSGGKERPGLAEICPHSAPRPGQTSQPHLPHPERRRQGPHSLGGELSRSPERSNDIPGPHSLQVAEQNGGRFLL